MNNKTNKKIDKPIRQLNALTMRFEWPLSRTKKNNALPSEKKINKNNTNTIALINIVIALTIFPSFRSCLVYSDTIRNASEMSLKIKNWKLAFLAFFFICLFSALGCWQLSRAAQKKLLLNSFHERSLRPPL